MTPREIIAKGMFSAVQRFGQSECELYAGHATQALHSAGYRILGPGEWDKETVEKCAEVIEQNMLCGPGGVKGIYPRTNPGNKVGLAYATAIRALAKEKQGC
jgi:hypothetical protein